jgi:hypothetical protein
MLTAEVQVEAERASRYLVQLCRHAASMAGTDGHQFRTHAAGHSPVRDQVQVRAEWSETHGVIRFDPWGQCTLEATATALVLRIEATGADGLRQIQDVITSDLGRFGRRDHLRVNWHHTEAPDADPAIRRPARAERPPSDPG